MSRCGSDAWISKWTTRLAMVASFALDGGQVSPHPAMVAFTRRARGPVGAGRSRSPRRACRDAFVQPSSPRGSRRPRSRRTRRRRARRCCRSACRAAGRARVSMIGVNGWFSANQLRPSGIESVGTKPLLEERQEDQEHRQVARGLDALRGPCPGRRTATMMASAASASRPAAASHSAGPVVGRKPMSTATTDDDRERQHRLDHAADDVAGQDRRRGRWPSCGSGR